MTFDVVGRREMHLSNGFPSWLLAAAAIVAVTEEEMPLRDAAAAAAPSGVSAGVARQNRLELLTRAGGSTEEMGGMCIYAF